MAPPAADRFAATAAQFLRLLEPRPGRLEFALRMALICTLTALVVVIYQTPSAAVTAYIAFFLSKPDRAESVLTDIAMLILITLIVGLAMLLTMAVIDAPFWRILAMSATSIGLLFLGSASKLRPLGGIVAMIVAYALNLVGTYHDGEIATRGLLFAWMFVGIPAGISILVNLLFAPAPRRLAQQAIAERLRLAAAILRAPEERSRRALRDSLREGIGDIEKWLRLARLERSMPPEDIKPLQQAAQSTAQILVWVDAAVLSRDALSESERAALAQVLEEMVSIMSRGGYPLEIALHENPSTGVPAADLKVAIWPTLKSLLTQFADPPASEPHAAAPPVAAASKGGFLLADAFTNPDHVHYALKTTAAAMFCYVLYSLLDWPGIHTCFITCYTVALTTTAETYEKLTLRILGCLVGAGTGLAAIVFVLPSLTSIQSLLGVVFLGALGSAWVAAGGPRIAYAGYQMAFAFFVCVIQSGSPAFDLTLARDRVIGILVGILAVYLAFSRLWPVNVAPRVDTAITALLRQLSVMLRTASSSVRGALAVRSHAALGAIEADLAVAKYEPASVRPSADWLHTRRQAAAEIGALAAPLLLLSADADIAENLARRLDRLTDGAPTADTPLPERPVTDLVSMHLRQLDQALKVTGHAPA